MSLLAILSRAFEYAQSPVSTGHLLVTLGLSIGLSIGLSVGFPYTVPRLLDASPKSIYVSIVQSTADYTNSNSKNLSAPPRLDATLPLLPVPIYRLTLCKGMTPSRACWAFSALT